MEYFSNPIWLFSHYDENYMPIYYMKYSEDEDKVALPNHDVEIEQEVKNLITDIENGVNNVEAGQSTRRSSRFGT
jgi:hypothetical protein